ncbi:hypothetical protein DFS34DRAFT_79058 [Phlyctochytrium arcticum]|nr:hypothetical protein DFS34DRAFT_79058 [Phlyctochytrium arcticum]
MAAAASSTTTAVSSTNPVFRDAIHAETVRKEMKRYTIYETYMLTPSVEKGLVVAEKPNRIVLTSMDKLALLDPMPSDSLTSAPPPHDPHTSFPPTSNRSYGWEATVPFVRNTDPRFYHPKVETEITKMYGTKVVPGSVEAKKKESGGK